jgi:hypothetical protein
MCNDQGVEQVKGLQRTVLVLALAIISSQTIHYVYMKFLFPTTSVLDTPMETTIQQAKSLDELVEMYRKSVAEVEALESRLDPEEEENYSRMEEEPYKSQTALRSAITEWEARSERLRRVLVQWTYGLIVALAGVGAYIRRSQWLGTALVVAGLGEMLWWCSPSFEYGGSVSSLDRLLTTKLVLSLATAAVLGLTWRVWTRAGANAA